MESGATHLRKESDVVSVIYIQSSQLSMLHNMRLIIILSFLLVSSFLSSQVLAQNADLEIKADMSASYDPVIDPELFSTSITVDDDDIPPQEPNISKVVYQNIPDYTNLKERVDRLVHGIRKDLPPEFDHFGHEIRRYMARVGNVKIYEDEEYIKDQIRNIKKSQVIAEYWEKHLKEEIAAIQDIIDEDDVKNNQEIPFSTRRAFKQNSSTVTSFMIALKPWIDDNEQFLLTLYHNIDLIDVSYPELIITLPNERTSLFNALITRQTRLRTIRGYEPFAMMVY